MWIIRIRKVTFIFQYHITQLVIIMYDSLTDSAECPNVHAVTNSATRCRQRPSFCFLVGQERSAPRDVTGAKSRSPFESERASVRVTSSGLITQNDPSVYLSQVSFLFGGGCNKSKAGGARLHVTPWIPESINHTLPAHGFSRGIMTATRPAMINT